MQNNGFLVALAGVLLSLLLNVGILCYVFAPPSFGFDIFTSLSGLLWTGISLIPLIVLTLVCKYVFKYTGKLLNWVLLPSFIMIVFYILVQLLQSSYEEKP